MPDFLSDPDHLSPQQLTAVNRAMDGSVAYAFQFGIRGEDGRPYLTRGLLETQFSSVGVRLVDVEDRVAVTEGATVPVSEVASSEELRDRSIAAKAIFHAVHSVIGSRTI